MRTRLQYLTNSLTHYGDVPLLHLISSDLIKRCFITFLLRCFVETLLVFIKALYFGTVNTVNISHHIPSGFSDHSLCVVVLNHNPPPLVEDQCI